MEHDFVAVAEERLRRRPAQPGAVPAAARAAVGAHVDVVANADDPDGGEAAEGAIGPSWSHLDLVSGGDGFEIIGRPGGSHARIPSTSGSLQKVAGRSGSD